MPIVRDACHSDEGRIFLNNLWIFHDIHFIRNDIYFG
ncbi:hypothetical protein CLV73_1775 [Chryseobacterium geocarposphaerae]|uniref:Uncharacterized protein n=1 Tax=Chryseobacterium geocarposphaerae TaxID=1416776 RepID=A0A2M9CA71_9FLAO|nr:hypothetical protein CLV73_1775 [Chryseobacterium geocarposphaerae]